MNHDSLEDNVIHDITDVEPIKPNNKTTSYKNLKKEDSLKEEQNVNPESSAEEKPRALRSLRRKPAVNYRVSLRPTYQILKEPKKEPITED